ncbi:MAG TPA: ATP-binding protein [Chthonomonadaceae bacterium]|nr:ATP-binding protein [Chthonomonadaceae bacterium]
MSQADGHSGNGGARHEAAPLGVIVRGSLSDGLRMRLNDDTSVEDLRVGKFVVIEGERARFFAMINDVELSATHPGFLDNPPRSGLASDVLRGSSIYGSVRLRPMLMAPREADGAPSQDLLPVKTIPSHFSAVAEATRDDVRTVFGDEREDAAYFHVGEPLDMDTPVCLNLDRWIERSNAIFGKSGTGKTFLTRLCLCGAIKAEKAVHLIFDMHNEYGEKGTNEGQGDRTVYGLRNHFQSRVQIFTLDPKSSQRRGVRSDHQVRIPYSQLDVEDVLLLQRELNLSATAVETCYLLERALGEAAWFGTFLSWDADAIAAFCETHNAHAGALAALQRKLGYLVRQCRDFLVENLADGDDAVSRILGALQSGKNIVLEFGQYNRPVQYMLVANILTRRLHKEYVDRKEAAMGSAAAEPRPLVIVIEEAHKFLSPQLAGQTIFGTIARELRKYNVTLLIVDQRPSGIDDEVLSQVGTKICCLLDDDKDVDAVLTGVGGANMLRGVLASLDTRQQALIFGHAVPMPIVVRTRNYDETFYRAMRHNGESGDQKTLAERVARTIDLDFA